MGEVDKEENKHLPQLHWTELAVLIPIIIAILLIGLQPAPFFDTMNATVDDVVSDVAIYIPEQAPVVTFDSPADTAVALNAGE
jgi:NADH:ubiquinone oxidoreductase subunit 4 (subunit M)